VVPTLALQAVEHDHVIAEERRQAAVEDLHDVRFGDAAPQFMD